MQTKYDLVIIGGGINGCGIAADAAQRGLSVLLLEMDDIAAKTSSNSSNLIHGGLRYLEQYDFSLVKKALDERQVLLTIAPHLVHPLPFVLPYHHAMRPVWLLRTGLFIYDHISRKNKLPKSRFIRKKRWPEYFSPLQNDFKKGFVYHDCVTHDSRLTIENALQAKKHGATILTHSPFLRAEPRTDAWKVFFQQHEKECQVTAKCLVNAAGPWVNRIIGQSGQTEKQPIALVKGSHILTRKIYPGDHAYLLQHTDKRIIFIAPYHGFSMIGTTDVRVDQLDAPPQISAEEQDYLLGLTNHYFQQQLQASDIVHSWSGIRPLLDNPQGQAQELSRDYSFALEQNPAPIVNIYGGKITTYRQLANDVVDRLKKVFPGLPDGKTHNVSLPGGSIPYAHWEDFVQANRQQYAWLPSSLLNRLEKTYGARIHQLLKKCHQFADLGQHFGNGLYQREVDWLVAEEWAQQADDILWRRSKLGLYFNAQDKEKLSLYLTQITKDTT